MFLVRGWWLPSFVLGCVAAIVILQRFGFADPPLIVDRGYFTYVAQAVLRGEPYYETTLMGYPPAGAFISAASMWIGQWFGIPTYLAPRYLSVAVAAATVSLLLLVTRRTTGSTWVGVLAAVLLAGSHPFGKFAVGTLEPKSLVTLFTLVAALALQRRRWMAAGLAGGLAAMSFLPAVFVAICTSVVTAWGGRKTYRRAIPQSALGLSIAALPALLYIVYSASLWHFWQRAIVLPALDQLPGAGWTAARWWRVQELLSGPTPGATVVTACAALGFLLYAVRRRSIHASVRAWLHPRTGAMPLLTAIWVGFEILTFEAEGDTIPLLPFQAYWAAWFAYRVGVALRGRRQWRGAARSAFVLIVSAGALYVLLGGSRYRWPVTLAEQKAFVDQIVADAGPDGVISCFGAEWIYALGERRSPNPFLRLNARFVRFLELAEPEGCDGVLTRVAREQPAVVVIPRRRRSECVLRLQALLESRTPSGPLYDKRVVRLDQRLIVYRRKPR